MSKIKAGFARVCITPPLGTAMSGYFSPRYASAIHDDLYATAVAFDDGEKKAVVVAMDVAGMKNIWWRNDCLKMTAEFCGIPEEAVILNCSHTHTGPIIGPDDSSGADSNHAYDEILMQKVRDAAYMALADVRPAEFSAARTQVKDIAFIRLFRMKDGSVQTNPGLCNPNIAHPLGEPNETATLLKIEREGADNIFLVHFGVHADVIGGDVISADFPGFMRETVENALPGTKVMFLQGAEGDVNHNNVNLSERRKGFAYSRQMGRTLAAGVLRMCDAAAPIRADKISCGVRTVQIPTNPENDKLDIAREVVAMSRAGRKSELQERGITMRISEALRIIRLENGPDEYCFHLSAISIGDFVFAGLPGEPFVEIGRRIETDSPFPYTAVLALTDGAEIYFPTGNIYDEGGYEAKSSPIRKGADEILVRGMGELLREI
ncbi:MAG: hypothetical protein E7662_01555 [Ruminococcaceae bacterium]|nr:hypothetical protein [Oscillospiraceae bacterium]